MSARSPQLRAMMSLLTSGVLAMFGPNSADAATTTSTFNVQLVVTASCTIASVGNLDFGSVGLLNVATDASSTLQVQCTNLTPYNIGLDGGSTLGGTPALRLMTSGLAAVGYQVFSNAGRTINWGDTVGVDTVTSAGTGSAQNFTLYGRVPVQTSVAVGTYSDTVTVTVTY